MTNTYLLVHGAWMGAWVWDEVARGLRSQGHGVLTVELPAHGADTTPVPEATFEAYVAKVEAALDCAAGRVILVGHSMAGMVVSQVAENRGDRISKLVYLAAYLPQDGQKLLDLALTDSDSQSGQNLKIDEQNGVADIPIDRLTECFLADGSPAAIESLKAHYRPEPLAGFVAPVHLTHAWSAVRKVYLFTRSDRAISHGLQQRMTDGVQLESTHTFETSHSPFLSAHTEVVSVLASLAAAGR